MAFPPPPPNFGRSVPTETQSDLAAIVSCIRLLSHIATKENCAAHPGLYQAVIQATAGLRAAYDSLAAPETDAAARKEGIK